jgi:Uma2 family endonuclease
MNLGTHPTNTNLFIEEDMPESQSQINLSDYLKPVLKNLPGIAGSFITGNLAIYPPKDKEYPFINVAPDIAIFIGTTLTQEEQINLSSWRMSEANRPAPDVVFEISSEGTWPQDLDLKPDFYRLLGVKEYFAYDPQRVWRGANTQLRGWRYSNNQMEELQPDERGWLWSVQLNSWLAPDGAYLRLYDAQGNLRLTGEEAQAEQTRAEAARAKLEAERARAEAERARAEAERAQMEHERAEAERARAEAERAAMEALLEKLRKNNIDIDKL